MTDLLLILACALFARALWQLWVVKRTIIAYNRVYYVVGNEIWEYDPKKKERRLVFASERPVQLAFTVEQPPERREASEDETKNPDS